MAKILVAGHSAVITSSVKLEDIKKVSKYDPDKLTLKDEEGEIQFAVGIAKAKADTVDWGSISQYGVEFAPYADANGYAVVTATIDPEVIGERDIKDILADKLGGAVLKLEKVEAGIAPAIVAIDAEINVIKSHIQVA